MVRCSTSSVNQREFALTAQAGPLGWPDVAVDLPIDLNHRLWRAGVEGRVDPCTLVLSDAKAVQPLPVQWHDGRPSMLLLGSIRVEDQPEPQPAFEVLPRGEQGVPSPKSYFADRIAVRDLGRGLLFAGKQREPCCHKHEPLLRGALQLPALRQRKAVEGERPGPLRGA
jgi:hypothetical protein